ncbi:helix-turn-helix domain-containing protein [Micromonospora sp. WMMD998]|uniref:helix-turn-helix domain-containing protein n=1 Tax=Micromonospora sp. WMMD998 TaxID=3016092 RepID=UPI00249CBF33|nr:helix-turn-helix domain-containing protein [Micromonospora sp. WMMD998]WFE38058.1 helix-turn-helix domain-containing protein [Micromonospora sp. WMMD998]
MIGMDSVPGPVTSEQIRDLQKALGRQLAHWRKAAGMTQAALAKRTAYSRSSVANVEIGRNTITRGFWERADRELRAQGSLVDAFDTLQELITMLRRHRAWVAEHERLLRHQAAVPPKPPPNLKIATPGCGCTVAIARWREREVLALREALRLSLGAFAERLRVAPSIVATWEDRGQPEPPSLAMQAALDDLLKLADQDARTRFARILQMPPMRSTDHAGAPRTGRPATVTPLHRSAEPQAVR